MRDLVRTKGLADGRDAPPITRACRSDK